MWMDTGRWKQHLLCWKCLDLSTCYFIMLGYYLDHIRITIIDIMQGLLYSTTMAKGSKWHVFDWHVFAHSKQLLPLCEGCYNIALSSIHVAEMQWQKEAVSVPSWQNGASKTNRYVVCEQHSSMAERGTQRKMKNPLFSPNLANTTCFLLRLQGS